MAKAKSAKANAPALPAANSERMRVLVGLQPKYGLTAKQVSVAFGLSFAYAKDLLHDLVSSGYAYVDSERAPDGSRVYLRGILFAAVGEPETASLTCQTCSRRLEDWPVKDATKDLASEAVRVAPAARAFLTKRGYLCAVCFRLERPVAF